MSRKETVLITGASAGIGEELAKLFADSGRDLVLVARRKSKLQSLAKHLKTQSNAEHVWVEACDLSEAGAATALHAKLQSKGLGIDVLVNCAGVLEHGAFVEMGEQRLLGMVDLNIRGLTSLTALFLPQMLENGYGRILNVGSIAAFTPVPSLAAYAATKAYVLSLTEALSEELSGTGVTVTALCPGMTDTSMLSKAQENSEKLKLPAFAISDVEDVAKAGFDACLKGEVIAVPGSINLLTTLTTRATPKWLVRRVFGAVGRKSIS
ncbi:MAG: SDR family oxidoreductase [Congregibacter sp.]